jgi:hypothetical protein
VGIDFFCDNIECAKKKFLKWLIEHSSVKLTEYIEDHPEYNVLDNLQYKISDLQMMPDDYYKRLKVIIDQYIQRKEHITYNYGKPIG